MKALLQRVVSSKVSLKDKTLNEIGPGLNILFGVTKNDSKIEADYLAEKIVNLRIMSDEFDKMNKSVLEVNGEILVVSQFTLLSDTSKGRRPSFIDAAAPNLAEELYEYFVDKLKSLGVKKVVTGSFGEYMRVEIINDGPVTIMLDSNQLRNH